MATDTKYAQPASAGLTYNYVKGVFTGRMTTGYAILMDIEGNKIDFSYLPKGNKTPKLCNCKRISARSSVLVDVQKVT